MTRQHKYIIYSQTNIYKLADQSKTVFIIENRPNDWSRLKWLTVYVNSGAKQSGVSDYKRLDRQPADTQDVFQLPSPLQLPGTRKGYQLQIN